MKGCFLCRGWRWLAAAALALLWGIRGAAGQVALPEALRQVRLEQRAGQRIGLDLAFVDEQGLDVRLGSYLGQRPALLMLTYYTCPNLCPMLLRHVTQALNGTALIAGRDFDVIVVSFDPADTPASAAMQKIDCVRAYRYGGGGGGWHFLTGQQSQIDALLRAAGFHCVFDPHKHQYAHPLGLIVLAPDGTISHDFFGVDFSPADVEAALQDAAAGRVTRVSDPQQQYCLDYSPSTTRFGRVAVHGLQAVSAVWVVAIVAFISRELVRDRRGRPGGQSVGEVQS